MDKKEKKKIADKKYRQSAKGKESKARANKKYSQSEKGKEAKARAEQNRDQDKKRESNKQWRLDNPDKVKISGWKLRGIICDDYDNVYSVYMDTNNCDYCKKEFKDSLDRCLDHDHDITDANNIRGILCRVCNIKDVLKGCPPIF